MQAQGTALRCIGVVVVVVAMMMMVMVPTCGGQDEEREVVVIGGGLAGLAAARHITNQGRGRFTVRVFEARRERYGGRVWTDRLKNPKARGLEVDFGAFALNTGSPFTNPLLNLTRDLGLETSPLGPAQVIVPSTNARYSGDELAKAFAAASAILQDAVNRSRGDRRDVSVRAAVDRELKERGLKHSHLHSLLLRSLSSYLLPDYSSHLYQPHALDFGFDQVLLDGMGELLDRFASGTEDEAPLKIRLRTAVRQVKVDRSQGKVILRLKDGSQVTVDEVVVAVPISVIASGDLLFEPTLPKPYVTALKNIGMTSTNKVLVEFDVPFWPEGPGLFVTGVGEGEEEGCLHKWVNVHKVLGSPVLMGLFSGPQAAEMEKLSDSDLKDLVLRKLQKTFGEDSVSSKNILKIRRSSWMSDPWSQGGSSYPSVGDRAEMWDTFSEPWCPNIYFAGEHTSFRHHGTLHGAYLSGQRAADQILSGYCKRKAEEEEKRRKEEEERKRKEKGKNKTDKGEKQGTEEQEEENSNAQGATSQTDKRDEL